MSLPIQTVEAYFAAVDSKRVQDVLRFLTPDAQFRIATFDTTFHGRDTEIRGMFERLFERYETVWHGDFDHVDAGSGRIASQFRVVNVTHDGQHKQKFNANFFTMNQAGLFTHITVYMSGDNSLA